MYHNMNAFFYGFQFPHHGRFTAFSALSKGLEQIGIPVFRTSFPSFLDHKGLRRFMRLWFQVNEYRLRPHFSDGSLVHYFFPENSLFRAPKWKKDGKLVLSCHQPYEQMARARSEGKLVPFFEGLRAADAVVLMASCEIEAYRTFAPDSEILCIPLGVDTDFFFPGQSPLPPDGCFKVLTVGNCLRDYELWAKVVERVVSDNPYVNFTVIANPDRIDLATRNLTTGPRNVRTLHGISDEQLRSEYQRADIIFLPLVNAWANNALLEALACGKAVVITDLPATREYGGAAACYVEKGSVAAAAEALLRLGADSDARSILGWDARQRVEAQFSWKRIAEQHRSLYQRLNQKS